MKQIRVTFECDKCGFKVERIFYTNEYGYFEFPGAQCPNDMRVLAQSCTECPEEVVA